MLPFNIVHKGAYISIKFPDMFLLLFQSLGGCCLKHYYCCCWCGASCPRMSGLHYYWMTVVLNIIMYNWRGVFIMIHTFPFYFVNCVSRSIVLVTGTNCLVECTVDLLIEFVVFQALGCWFELLLFDDLWFPLIIMTISIHWVLNITIQTIINI